MRSVIYISDDATEDEIRDIVQEQRIRSKVRDSDNPRIVDNGSHNMRNQAWVRKVSHSVIK